MKLCTLHVVYQTYILSEKFAFSVFLFFLNYTNFLSNKEHNSNDRYQMMVLLNWLFKCTGPDSLVVRASASGSEGCGFAPRPRHTKGVKNGTGSFLADARNKRVVLGRYKNAGRYLLLVMSQ